MQGLLVFCLFGTFRLCDVLGSNDLYGNSIKLPLYNLSGPEN